MALESIFGNLIANAINYSPEGANIVVKSDLIDTHISERAARFHASMAHALLAQALQVREDSGVRHVALSGGVFQNRVLTEHAIALLNAKEFTTTLPGSVPVNDGGIAFGQIVEAAHRGPD